VALIETMRWSPSRGVRLLDRHLARLAESADYWEVPFDGGAVRDAMARFVSTLSPGLHRLRLRLGHDGTPSFTSKLFVPERRTWRAIVAAEPVDSSSPFLFHKTERRDVYDRALAEARSHGADEVLLWNERGELTEGSRTNLVVKLGGEWLTPARECGLLAGVMRAHLLDRRWIREAVIRKEELLAAGRIAVVSALRGIVRVELA
jgi:para-aminobenzoate synthetase/4-amino-4-deoxychorismate lyase